MSTQKDDPRRPNKIFRYKPLPKKPLDDPTTDYMNLLGMIFSMCGLMMRVRKLFLVRFSSKNPLMWLELPFTVEENASVLVRVRRISSLAILHPETCVFTRSFRNVTIYTADDENVTVFNVISEGQILVTYVNEGPHSLWPGLSH